MPNEAPTPDHQETRLQAVERTASDLKADVALAGQAVKNLEDHVTLAYEHLGQKIDAMVAPWTEKVREVAGHVEAQGEKLGEHARDLARLVEKDAKALAWRDGLRKAGITVLTGVVAIVIKELIFWAAK